MVATDRLANNRQYSFQAIRKARSHFPELADCGSREDRGVSAISGDKNQPDEGGDQAESGGRQEDRE